MNDSVFRKRLLFFICGLGVAGLALVIHYASIMFSGPLAAPQPTPASAVERGAVTDRNGRLLALQTLAYTCSVWAPNLKQPDQEAELLAPLIGADTPTLGRRLSEARGSIILKTGLPPDTAAPIRALIDQGRLPGIYLEETAGRAYPEGRAAAHVVGFTGAENIGMEGVEYVLENELARRNPSMPDGRSYGNQVALTLDMGVQHAMEAIADQAMADNKPEGLVILVMDAPTGELLAWVVRPGYDPNDFRSSTPEQRRNLPVHYTYEPGSVFKIFTVSGIMQLGGISDSTQFHTSGGYRNKLFRDPITDLADYGTITPEGVIKFSSNVGAAYASDTVDDPRFSDMLRAWGFGDKTGVEVNGEESGLLKPTGSWTPRTKPTMAIGQEVNVTALQMITAATAIANRGVLLRPHIIKRITSPNGSIVAEFGRQPVREIISPAVASRMLGYMNAATEDSGTGRRSRVAGINLSVKTGTAQYFDKKRGRYSETDFIASSLAIFPTENPRAIVYIVVIKPKGESIYGGRVAAPLVKSAAEFLIPYLGIDRAGDLSYVQGEQIKLTMPSLPPINSSIPDFTGLPLRVLLPLYQRTDLRVEISGEGHVRSQEPPPGTPFTAGMTLKLQLGQDRTP